METDSGGGAVLKRALFLSLIFIAAFAVLALSAPAFAAADDDPDGDKLEADANTAGALILLEIDYAIEAVLRGQIIDDYDEKYDDDHKALAASSRIDPSANPYETRAPSPVGYRYKNASQNDVYALIYKDRRRELLERLESVLKTNAGEGLINMNEGQTWINDARSASVNADGYMKILEAAAQESNLMNVEILQLRADILRQTDIQLAAEDALMQDEADETAAIEQAVKTWSAAGTGTNY
ncbi:MAG: hypothetical protein LBS35_05540 [Synergistaceae bacterium]|jgi:hypothetical protein|nr:hypothetical protein [Synergistaceae bacterium]